MTHTSPRKALVGGIFIVVLAALAYGGYRLHDTRLAALQQVPAAAKFPWAMRTVPVVRRDLTNGFPVLATLSSQAEVAITPQISGVIRQMGPREGEVVKKGALLVQLDIQELDNQLAALKASQQAARDNAALSRSDLARQEALLEKGFATQATVDTLRTAQQTATQKVNQLSGDIEALKTRIRYGTILAPMDGVISARLQEPGDLAAPGRAIFRITAATGAKIKITVPQAVAARLHKGSDVRLDHGAGHVTVAISRIFPSLDALSMGTAEADLKAIPFDLPSGARLPGRVILDRLPGVFVVPRTALILSPDGESGTLFRVLQKPGADLARLDRVKVKIVASGREGVAVSGDIGEGDRVAIARENELLKLRDGDAVLPEPDPETVAAAGQ